MQGIVAVAVLLIQFSKTIQKPDAPGPVIGKHFGNHERTVNRVLVAHIGARQVPIALLKSHDIRVLTALLFQQPDLLANELEAGQDIDGPHAVMRGNPLRHINGDNGLHHDRILGHGPGRQAPLTDVIKEQHSGFIAGEKDIFPLCIPHGNPDTVTVRIGGHEEVCLFPPGIFHAQRHGLVDFRIRIRTGREMAIRLFLFRHHGDVGIARLTQGPQNRHQTGPVERGVDDGGTAVRRRIVKNALLFDLGNKAGQHLIPDFPNPALPETFLKFHAADIIKGIDPVNFCQNGFGCLRGNLASIRSVDLIAIVFGRIVRGGHHDSGRTVQFTDGKGQARSGHQLRINPYLNAIGCKNTGSHLRKQVRLDPGIIADRNPALFRRKMGNDVIGQSLRSFPDRVDIHPVRAGTNHPAQTACAEFQFPVKGILDQLRLSGHGSQFRAQVRISVCPFTPSQIVLFNIHPIAS